jgi:hypothetical protein
VRFWLSLLRSCYSGIDALKGGGNVYIFMDGMGLIDDDGMVGEMDVCITFRAK